MLPPGLHRSSAWTWGTISFVTNQSEVGQEIRANSVLPARRESISLRTSDGLTLVGELASPAAGDPTATIVCVHPLPIAGGMMDSHLFRKAAWRLPALAGIAVLRFNTRGTESASGRSEGAFDNGEGEGLDLAAAVNFTVERGLPAPWLVGWSFGTDVIIKHPEVEPTVGAILLSPPLRYSSSQDMAAWAKTGKYVLALVPELDDFLRPDQARREFAGYPQAEVKAVNACKHLWVGEGYVRRALNEIVRTVTPVQGRATDLGEYELPTSWDGPMEKWSDPL